jgi:NAD(P)H-hydrate epimerase
MVGAPFLCAEAARRVGAGLVTVASEAAITDKLERRVEEIMTLSFESFTSVDGATRVLSDFIKRRNVTAVAVGPGLPTPARVLVRAFVAETSLPIVIDAGALSAYTGELAALKAATVHNSAIVLTPHTGEYRRLSGVDIEHEPNMRRREAEQFAIDNQVTLVLKGRHTLVANPSGALYENQTGNPGLAKAGTGDVLTGMIAGILAQGFDAYEAAAVSVYLHGLAGDLAAAAETEAGVLASDLLSYLPAALRAAYDSAKY